MEHYYYEFLKTQSQPPCTLSGGKNKKGTRARGEGGGGGGRYALPGVLMLKWQ